MSTIYYTDRAHIHTRMGFVYRNVSCILFSDRTTKEGKGKGNPSDRKSINRALRTQANQFFTEIIIITQPGAKCFLIGQKGVFLALLRFASEAARLGEAYEEDNTLILRVDVLSNSSPSFGFVFYLFNDKSWSGEDCLRRVCVCATARLYCND